MGDITEVIHKISYEVNDDALNNATKAIQLQIAELDKLGKALDGYARQLDKLSSIESKQLDELSKKIEDTFSQITKVTSVSKSLLTEVFKGIAKGLTGNDSLNEAVSKYIKSVIAEFGKLQLAGKQTGIGFAQHMKGINTTGSSVGATLLNMGKSLLSFTNVVGIAVSILPLLVDLFSETSDNSGDAAESISRFQDKIEDVSSTIASEVVEMDALILAAQDVTLSYQQREDAVVSLQKKYPTFFGILEKEKILNGDIKNAYDDVTNSIVSQAEARVKLAVLEEAIAKQVKAKLDLDDYNSPTTADGVENYKIFNGDDAREAELKRTLKFATENVERVRKSLYNSIPDLDGVFILDDELRKQYYDNNKGSKRNENTGVKYHKNDAESTEKRTDIANIKPDFSATFTEEDYKAVEDQTKEISAIYVDKLQQALDENIASIKIGEQESLLTLEKIYAEGLRTKEDYEKGKTAIVAKSRAEQIEMELSALQVMKSEYDESSNEYKELYGRQLSLQIEAEKLKGKKIKKDDNDSGEEERKKKNRFKSAFDPFKNVSEEQKENIKESIEGYQQLSQAAADAYNKIIQAQIDALDKEISIREKRVEEAKKLAERGNTEALRLEEDRLRKAQEQRAKFARQQQTVNAAITVSNAIAAVARAALDGGGFGSAATIAALIAALAAGYAAVSSMTSDSESFATGVVDYKGKGGPRDDKNWVRISSGESIITAAGTQKNRALLEAINQGAALHMIDPTLPMTMPLLKQPGTQQGNAYAEAKDLKRLETKLDEVVGAIENNKLKQNIFFNEQGVGIMTERAIQKDRKRWK